MEIDPSELLESFQEVTTEIGINYTSLSYMWLPFFINCCTAGKSLLNIKLHRQNKSVAPLAHRIIYAMASPDNHLPSHTLLHNWNRVQFKSTQRRIKHM